MASSQLDGGYPVGYSIGGEHARALVPRRRSSRLAERLRRAWGLVEGAALQERPAPQAAHSARDTKSGVRTHRPNSLKPLTSKVCSGKGRRMRVCPE